MRRFIALPALLGVLFIYSFQCRRDDTNPPGDTLKGKLVLNGPCGNYVIQVLEGNISPDKMVASWKQPQTDSVFTNVFTVANSCNFGGNNLQQEDIFTFQLDATPAPQNCMLCMIYVPTPTVSNAVKNVQKLK
jgi:hypothetical protein